MNTKEATLEVKVAPFVAQLTPETVKCLIEQGQGHLFEWLRENAPEHINSIATGLAILEFLIAEDENGENYHPLDEFDALLIDYLNSLTKMGWW